MIKVGIYCRVSGLSQRDNSSLKSQKNLGIEFCKRSKYDYEIFSDSESGAKLDRKEFSRLLELCKSGEIDGIWVYDNDRLSRDYDVGGEIRRLIIDLKLRLFINYEEVKLEEGKDRFSYNIRSVLSDYEKFRIVERFDYGKQFAYSKGKGLGIIGFGYEKDRDGNVVINEDEREVVEDIVRLYLRKDIKFMSEVESRIDKKYGKVLNGKRLNGGLVGRVLGNRMYLGKIYRKDFEGKKYEFDIGRIVSDEDFEKVIKKKDRVSKFERIKGKNKYLLKGKVRCGSCGSNMWVRRGGKKSEDGKGWSYYYCSNKGRKQKYDIKFDRYVIEENRFRKNRKVDLKEYEKMYGKFEDCKSVKENIISIERLEELVWKCLYDFMIKSKKIKKEYKLRYENKLGDKDRFSGKLKYYESIVDEEKEKKLNMIDDYLKREIDSETKDDWIKRSEIKVRKVKQKINDIKKEISKLSIVDKIDGYVDLMKSDLKKEFGVERFEDRKRVIEKYVEDIKVKLIDFDSKKKKYEVDIRLYYGVGNDDKRDFSLNVENLRNKIDKISYILKYGLAQRRILVYNKKLIIILKYEFVVKNIGNSKNVLDKNERKLVEIR